MPRIGIHHHDVFFLRVAEGPAIATSEHETVVDRASQYFPGAFEETSRGIQLRRVDCARARARVFVHVAPEKSHRCDLGRDMHTAFDTWQSNEEKTGDR